MVLSIGLSLQAQAVAADSLYIGDNGDNSVKRFDAATGVFQSNFVAPGSNGLLGPRGVIFSRGFLHVANQNANQPFAGEIQRYTLAGGIASALIPCNPPLRVCNVNAPFAPRGIIRGPHSTFYVADWNVDAAQGRVAKYNVKTGAFISNLDTTGFTPPFFPRGIVRGSDGFIYVSATGNPNLGDFSSGYILRFSTRTGKFVNIFASNLKANCGNLNFPEGIAFGPDDKLYVATFSSNAFTGFVSNQIMVINTNGQCLPLNQITLNSDGKIPAKFSQAFVFGPGGKLFVPITNTGEVRRYNVATKTFDIFIPAGTLIEPWYLTFGKTDPNSLDYDD